MDTPGEAARMAVHGETAAARPIYGGCRGEAEIRGQTDCLNHTLQANGMFVKRLWHTANAKNYVFYVKIYYILRVCGKI
jgi:hypothetical protein